MPLILYGEPTPKKTRTQKTLWNNGFYEEDEEARKIK
jgi:hypothetical protein